VTAGANVLLLEPADDSAFEGATQLDGVWYASPSQVAADLLTSPGRGPNEGEELIEWIEFEFAQVQKRSDKRLMIEIGETSFRVIR